MKKKLVSISLAHVAMTQSGERYAILKCKCFGDRETLALPVELIAAGDTREVFRVLAEADVTVIGRNERARALGKLQSDLRKRVGKPTARIIVADRRGWSGDGFVTKYGIHDATSQRVVTTPSLIIEKRDHLQNVDMKRVRAFFSRYGKSSSLARVVLSTSFVGPLLSVLQRAEQPWFTLIGLAGSGKSTLMFGAASTWGGRTGGL